MLRVRRVQAAYDRITVLAVQVFQRGCQGAEPRFYVHVLGAMHCHQEIAVLFHAQIGQRRGCLDAVLVVIYDFQDGIAGHENAIARYAFAEQVGPAAFGVRHEHVA